MLIVGSVLLGLLAGALLGTVYELLLMYEVSSIQIGTISGMFIAVVLAYIFGKMAGKE